MKPTPSSSSPSPASATSSSSSSSFGRHRGRRDEKVLIPVDLAKSPKDQPVPLHNRWHPDIPSVAKVVDGDDFIVECVDWTGGQIANDDSADDIRNVDLTQVHYLSGPIEVEGVEPGDLLRVEFLDLGYIEPWGFTGTFDIKKGGGLLGDEFPQALKAVWDLQGVWATSRHIPGVKLTGIIHPGLIGCAPSREVLEEWNRRERKLVETDPDRVPPLAPLPTEHGALVGKLEGTDEGEKVKKEAARTVPPREHGGNCDIKNLTRGSIAYFPVYVNGAKLSMGDMHFSQGDGEISFCGAIEMAGWLHLKINIIKQGVPSYAIRNPIFRTSHLEPHYSRFLTFEGISVTKEGEQKYLDASEAYRNACRNAIAYLKKFGWTGEQIYLMLSVIPCEGRIAGIVDVPNACATISIPLDVFTDTDLEPHLDAVVPRKDRGQVPIAKPL